MAITFCTKFDSSLNGTVDPCGADDIVPDSASWGENIDTTNQKFGAGCLGTTGGIDIEWHNIANPPTNSGAFSLWVRNIAGGDLYGDFDLDDRFGSEDRINLYWQMATDASGLQFRLVMRDSGGTKRIDASISESYTTDNNWHYIELNWLWNDAGGFSKVSFDGVVKLSDNGGNSYSRGTNGNDIELYGYSTTPTPPFPSRAYNIRIDDYTVFDAYQHSGNFSVPTDAQCACTAAANKRFLNLGAPFGGMNAMGR